MCMSMAFLSVKKRNSNCFAIDTDVNHSTRHHFASTNAQDPFTFFSCFDTE